MNNLSHLEQRAVAAYYRDGSRKLRMSGGGSINQPSAVETVEHDGLTYIRVSNDRGILAVYRVRTVNGEQVLKGMRRWPSALAV